MSTKKSHRLKQERVAAASAPPAPERGWPRLRPDAEAVGHIQIDKDTRAIVIGRVFENQDGSVFMDFPEGTKLVGEAYISYEATGGYAPQQADCTENPVQGESRYKRGRRWWEQGKWERSL